MENKNVERVKELYESGRAFKNGGDINLEKTITRTINFYEGKQWTNKEGTEDYPKIVINMIKQVAKVKQSSILQNDYSFLVNTLKFEDTNKLQYFMKYLYNKLKMKKKNLKVIKDNFLKGTSGLYFYWDNDARAVLDDRQGTLKCEVIDIRQLVVADPSIQDIQEQEWIIYNVREKVGALKQKYPDLADEIVADGYNVLQGTQREQIGQNEDDEFANVYIKYYRNEEGQVCYSINTEHIELEKAQFLNNDYKGSTEEQFNTLSMNDKKKDKKFSQETFSLYPFAIYVMDERDNCFYGVPGAYELIEAQKSINAHMSTYDYAIRQNVLGGFVVKKGALGESEISTDNGQVIELDLLPNENINSALGRLPIANVPTDSLGYSNTLKGLVQSAAGAQNVQMGQADYSNQTAKATEMLLARAKENSSDYAILFEEYMKDCANIMFMFAKFFYERKEFNIVEHGNEVNSQEAFKAEKAFKGKDYVNEEIDFDIQISPSNALNESTLQQLAMMAVQTGNISLSTMLDILPYNTFGSYKELKDKLAMEDQRNKQLQQLQAQLQQSQQVMNQMAESYKKLQEDQQNIDIVVKENYRLKQELADITAKAIQSANESAAKVNEMTREMQNVLGIVTKQKGQPQTQPQNNMEKSLTNVEK